MAFDKFLRKLVAFPSDVISLFIFSWIWGAHLTGTLAGILTLIHLPILVKNLSILILAFSGLTVTYKWLKKEPSENTFKLSVKFPLLILFITAVAVTPVLIIKSYQPFPNAFWRSTHMDPLFVQAAYRMLYSGYLEPEIRWPNAVFPYIMLSLFRVKPLHFLWSAPFILAIIYAIGLFNLSYILSKNMEIALLCVLFGMFINAHVGWPGQFILHFKSNQILYAIFPLVLYSIYEKTTRIKSKPIMTFKEFILLSTTLALIFILVKKTTTLVPSPDWHYFGASVIYPISRAFLPFLGILLSLYINDRTRRGLFLLVFLYSVIFYFWHAEEALLFILTMLLFVLLCDRIKNEGRHLWIWALAFITFIYIYLQWIDLFHVPNIPISAIWSPSIVRAGTDVFNIKRTCFNFANREVLRALMVIGAVFALTSRKRENLIAIAMLAATLLIFFLPEYHTIR